MSRAEYRAENDDAGKSPPMAVERHRRETFRHINSLNTRITKIYAASGLYLLEEHKGRLELSCAWCEFRMNFSGDMATNKQTAQELLDKHVMEYYCDFITGRESKMRNVPDLFNDECWMNLAKPPVVADEEPTDQLGGFQINYNHAKYPGMAVRDRRQASFLTFPSESTQNPDALVEAGYFCISGTSDRVKCFMCGVVSSNWNINETPWQRHARSSRTCQHVMSQKGEEFVKITLQEFGEYIEQNETIVYNVPTRMVRDRMASKEVQDVISRTRIKRDHIKTVVRYRIMQGEPDFTRQEDLVRAIHELPPSLLHTENGEHQDISDVEAFGADYQFEEKNHDIADAVTDLQGQTDTLEDEIRMLGDDVASALQAVAQSAEVVQQLEQYLMETNTQYMDANGTIDEDEGNEPDQYTL